jgi:hypothetical protein
MVKGRIQWWGAAWLALSGCAQIPKEANSAQAAVIGIAREAHQM